MWERGAGEARRTGGETAAVTPGPRGWDRAPRWGTEVGLRGAVGTDRDEKLRFGQVQPYAGHADGDTCYFVQLFPEYLPWLRCPDATVNRRDVVLDLVELSV